MTVHPDLLHLGSMQAVDRVLFHLGHIEGFLLPSGKHISVGMQMGAWMDYGSADVTLY